jgi:hypothetical protein
MASFKNEADGTGYTSFQPDEGIQTDPGGDIDLNGAEWESIGFRVGAVFLL